MASDFARYVPEGMLFSEWGQIFNNLDSLPQWAHDWLRQADFDPHIAIFVSSLDDTQKARLQDIIVSIDDAAEINFTRLVQQIPPNELNTLIRGLDDEVLIAIATNPDYFRILPSTSDIDDVRHYINNWDTYSHPSLVSDVTRLPVGYYEDVPDLRSAEDFDSVRNYDDHVSHVHSMATQNQSADILSQAGYNVDMGAPEFPLPNGRRVDLRIEGQLFDVYSPLTDNLANIWDTVSRKISKGQGNRYVINLSGTNVNPDDVIAQFSYRVDGDLEGLEELIIITDANEIIHALPERRP